MRIIEGHIDPEKDGVAVGSDDGGLLHARDPWRRPEEIQAGDRGGPGDPEGGADHSADAVLGLGVTIDGPTHVAAVDEAVISQLGGHGAVESFDRGRGVLRRPRGRAGGVRRRERGLLPRIRAGGARRRELPPRIENLFWLPQGRDRGARRRR
jgi:hypothetical protein